MVERLAPYAPLDWDGLRALARRHRVVPLFASRVESLAAQGGPVRFAIPPQCRQALRDEARGAMASELAMLAELRRVSSLFQRESIDFLLFKGLTLSSRGFGRPGMRTNRDIDLLVALDDLQRAHEALSAAGYLRCEPVRDASPEIVSRHLIRRKDWVYIQPDRGIILELHYRLFDNAALCDPGILDRAEPIDIFGQLRVPAMSIGDELSYLALHGAAHAWSRLKWLVDFAVRLRDQDRASLRALLREARGGPSACALHQAISLCWRLFDPAEEEPRDHRPWRAAALSAAAMRAISGYGAVELEDTRYGTTIKNASHYLLWGDPAYLLEEARYDLTDMSRSGGDGNENIPIWLSRPLAWLKRDRRSGATRPVKPR